MDADDAWSETFLSALRAYPTLRPGSNVEAWLVTIAHRKAIDQARKALGAGTNAEAVRLAVDRVVEMERFWRFMAGARGTLKAGSIEAP